MFPIKSWLPVSSCIDKILDGYSLYILSHTVVISGTVVPVDEKEVQVSFYQWLSSVTERINQTMHYQFDGSFSFIRSQCDIDVINYLLLWGHFIFTVPGDF